MKKSRANRKKAPKRLLCALLAALLLTGVVSCAGTAEGLDPMLVYPDLILAQNTADHLHLKAADGSELVLRSDLTVPGRGEADAGGNEPDYSGMLGFAVLPKDPEIGRSADFATADWQVPLYRKAKDGVSLVQSGKLAHKTPVLVTRQGLKPDGEGGYTGWLEIVRLDVRAPCFLDVTCFSTVPYWNLPVTEIPAYGYSIAVYRESPGEAPRDEFGNSCVLRDGTSVLIPVEGAFPVNSPEPDQLTVQGIVFTADEAGNQAPNVIYFREDDLRVFY